MLINTAVHRQINHMETHTERGWWLGPSGWIPQIGVLCVQLLGSRVVGRRIAASKDIQEPDWALRAVAETWKVGVDGGTAQSAELSRCAPGWVRCCTGELMLGSSGVRRRGHLWLSSSVRRCSSCRTSQRRISGLCAGAAAPTTHPLVLCSSRTANCIAGIPVRELLFGPGAE